ncbi:branched-chain amino acid ABC transporter permease [Verminephrobacter eiseniae]|uniref:branched-chain amino acid ABC transporter permease n=1 Tax=Verminephrobacter eiseniae TaxID=364317 RepID=UPI002238910A|nr:branched-chain amino acid ABC transporter permease [Verminephrobacter eiseniae]MCW5233245.1 branched-chain amino acid ABC transporter permease [Verminephrobacter eiseniae]MCW5295201.1 branched-chain amino acid ABC transporter permease [Verminephrobacter eiseniae]MCW8184147.1 branched-chain amino acid ABC transporter permease [Verminephrobacter eiseniae]MCW8222680.1 branched-chain amino acid ABC transporter permease [Verminephrobacter eiseniae]MCW8234150.1 branched-chain amino acid ABC trans
MSLFFVQGLNGLQFGVLLFLMAAGLTLVFGIMNFVNLAHGSLYMMGAFIAASLYNFTGSFWLATVGMIPAMSLLGLIMERIALYKLYDRDHLDQVLATFGLILFFNELARTIWGSAPYYMQVPEALSGTIALFGIDYPAYRFAIIVVGLLVAALCYLLIHHTRIGMLIRAGSSNRVMVAALGVNIKLLNSMLFALGAALAGVAGLMAGPIISVQAGMGEPVLILTMVVIVIGGIGSIRGAFLSAIIVGVVDTLGRTALPLVLREFLDRNSANAAGPALASMLIYVLMAAVLAWRPQGLFPVRNG